MDPQEPYHKFQCKHKLVVPDMFKYILDGFGKLSMGNEMGNNNTTSALNEEANSSEAEKKTFNEEVRAESKEGESQKISAAKGSDDETKADGLASNDRNEPGNETLKGDILGDGKKGENQTAPTSEARCQIEETAMASDDAIVEPGKDTLEEDSHADDVKGPNQMIPTADNENVEEKARGLTTVESAIMLENDSPKSDTHGDVVIVESQMPPAVEVEDVLNDDRSLVSNDVPNELENAIEEGNACEDDKNGDHQNHPSTEETHYNDEPRENAMDPISRDSDGSGKATNLSSDDQANVKDSFSDSGNQITEIIQLEMYPNAGMADKGAENCKTLSEFSLKSTEEYDGQIDLCKDQPVAYDHHLDEESSIKQEEENTVVSTSNDVELQESSQIHSLHVEFGEVLEEPSLQGSESLKRSDLSDTDTLPLMDDDISSDKEKDSQENVLCGVSSEGGERDESGSRERRASEITDNFSSINEKSDCSLLAEANCITDHSVDSPPESNDMYKGPLFDSEKMCKELQEDRKSNLRGSEMENSQDFQADIINRRSNGEENVVLAGVVHGIGETDQVEEKFTENGHRFDACINNNTNSNEISTTLVQQGFMVPEAEGDGLIPGPAVVNCRPEQEKNYEEKVLDEIEKRPEAKPLKDSDGNDMSEQFDSHLLTSGQKESQTLQNSCSMLPIPRHQDDNVSQTKIFTFANLQASDHQEGNTDLQI
ncbi:uncharacterized protein LOC114733182 [Neltuma alba]|uniref:uncharacterized protein LOC114733182 n=1 Tax=Neltuma alba TaxID=207710 RepID=UPI0010A3FCAC|nr:uncharacterized protein LOC114733182 [Prosopis alba]